MESSEKNSTNKIEWLALEYEHNVQGVDWFWALGIIILAISITSIIYKNYFFAILIILGGFLLAYFNIRKPEMIDYELNEEGLKIKNKLYPYKDIKHFWVQKESPKMKPLLFINSNKNFMPIISMPIYPGIAEKIRNRMLAEKITEKETKEHPSVEIMEFLGF